MFNLTFYRNSNADYMTLKRFKN